MDRNRADTDRLNIDNGIRISLNLPVVRPYHTRRRKLRIWLRRLWRSIQSDCQRTGWRFMATML